MADDSGEKKKKNFGPNLPNLEPLPCGGNDDKSGFNGAVVRLLTAQVPPPALLATKLRVSGTSHRQLSDCVFPAELATGRGRERKFGDTACSVDFSVTTLKLKV